LIDPIVGAWEAWLPRRLRVVDGTVLQRGFGSLLPDPVVGESVLPLIVAVHEAESVADALGGQSGEVAVPLLARLVLHGILQIA